MIGDETKRWKQSLLGRKTKAFGVSLNVTRKAFDSNSLFQCARRRASLIVSRSNSGEVLGDRRFSFVTALLSHVDSTIAHCVLRYRPVHGSARATFSSDSCRIYNITFKVIMVISRPFVLVTRRRTKRRTIGTPTAFVRRYYFRAN